MIRRMRPHLALALVVTAVALWAAGGGMWLPMVRQAHSPSNVIVAATLARQPLLFVANSGQAEPWSTFVAQGETTSVLFGPGGARVRLAKAGAARSLACRGKHGDGVCLGAIGAGGPPDPLAPLSAGARAGDALYVVSLSGMHSGTNPVTGDFSVGAQGYMIRDGQRGEPVREVTIASTIPKMLLDLAMVGNDTTWLSGSTAGNTLLFSEMAVSGS